MKFSANAIMATGFLVGTGLLNAQTSPSGETDSHGDPFTPIGSLTVTPTVVQPGVQPDMTWEIEYPKSIPDLAVIVPPGQLLTTNDKPNKLEVRVAGVSFGAEGSDLPVALWIRTSTSGAWELVFYGRESDVNPSQVLYSETVHEGTQIDYAARGQSPSGAWYPTYWTLADNPNVEAVIDGDSLPSDSPAFTGGDLESYMTQFVDSNNQVEAGPRDILHLFEVGSTEPGTTAFDMQDIVVVTTLMRDNKGHGNNIDGVDADNTGASTGTAGSTDSGTLIDDEQKWITRKVTTTTTTTTTTGG